MTDEAELVAAIRARPDDDEPRLVYADWLSERGDPRGELIVLELALASSSVRPRFDPRPERLATLKESERLRWPAELRDATLGVDWERGLVARIYARADLWPRSAEEVRRWLPLLDRVTLSFGHQGGSGPVASRLRGAPSLAGLGGLELTGWRDEGAVDAVAELVSEVILGGATNFALGIDWCGAVGFELVARVLTPQVRRLSFRRVSVPLSVIESSVAWSDVEELSFLAGGLASDHLVRLARSRLPSLRRLAADSNQLGSSAMAALAGAPWFAQLSSLSLARNRIGHRGVEALSAIRSALRRLDLGHNSVGDLGAKALAATPWAASLERLGLSKAQLRDAAAASLCAAPFDALIDLDLSENAFSDETRASLTSRFGPRIRF